MFLFSNGFLSTPSSDSCFPPLSCRFFYRMLNELSGQMNLSCHNNFLWAIQGSPSDQIDLLLRRRLFERVFPGFAATTPLVIFRSILLSDFFFLKDFLI